KEGLAKAGKDRSSALARLEQVNRAWLQQEALARAKRGSDPEGADEPFGDPKVTLVEQEGTERFLRAGGTRESEQAVQLGLQWLASQQQLNGSWPGKGQGEYADRAGQGDMVGTAFGVWPFLARGETHKGSQEIHTYTKLVDNALKFLLS